MMTNFSPTHLTAALREAAALPCILIGVAREEEEEEEEKGKGKGARSLSIAQWGWVCAWNKSRARR
ncbi:unnamed protein product [Taenia asiatica]|uniref:Uncharacterized protein n=1 Tax=Taenia asiatica TaxID=60517 RepID=A0A0R3W5M9_TAEAS|nr:unnamed protein product [Taenia asiatica]